MRISKRVLAHLDKVYAVAAVPVGGQIHLIAATEAHGECLLFSPPDWRASVVWEGPGGTMSIAALPGSDAAFLAVQERFFPDAERAGIVCAQADSDTRLPWAVRRIIDLPFVHRFEFVRVGSKQVIVAATLIGRGANATEWQDPCAVYAGPVPERTDGPWQLEPVLEGITKNHGLFVERKRNGDVVLVSAHEGVFALHPPARGKERWTHDLILPGEVSDIVTADIDGDGRRELLSIAPLHGHIFAIHKKGSGGRWREVYSSELDFGHVVWGGELLGEPAIIVGSRGGNKALTLLRPHPGRVWQMETTIIDEGVGPNQIAVVQVPGRTQILSANHGAGEVALYDLTD
jgi:hypothetical protein